MEQKRINTIWNELIALDPSLKEHEAGIRAMITDISGARPMVEIDPAFRTGLRARLMLREMPIASPFSPFAWVAFRLLPLGAVALLVFTLTNPTPTYITPVIPTTTETRVMESTLQYDATDTESEASQSSQNAMPENDMYMETESTMSLKQTADMAFPPEFPMRIEPQLEGVLVKISSITSPTSVFVIIVASYPTGDQIIGTSPLLSSGTSENVPVHLKTRMVTEGIYRAEVYRDNGDRLFVWEEDTILTDENGYPWSVPLTVVSE